MVPFVTFRHKALQLRNHYSDFFSLDTHHLDQQGGLTLTVVLHCKLRSLLVLTITIYSVMGRSVWASCICGHQVLLLYATSGNVGCCSSATDFSAKLQETSILSGIPQLDCNLISLSKSLAKHALFRSWTWSLTQLPKMWGTLHIAPPELPPNFSTFPDGWRGATVQQGEIAHGTGTLECFPPPQKTQLALAWLFKLSKKSNITWALITGVHFAWFISRSVSNQIDLSSKAGLTALYNF